MSATIRHPSSAGCCVAVLCGLLLGVPLDGHAQTAPEAEAEVKATVEAFLDAAGRYDIDALRVMFAPGASIASAALREGRWVTSSQSADAWLAAIRAAPARPPYQEPVSHFTVHIDDGQLAFVRADAHLIRDDRVRSHNIDYFTLIRDSDGNWKFVNGSYTTKPAG